MVERYDEVQAWGSRGDGEGELDAPFGIAVDHAGLVYVADTSNHRIVKFTATGGYVDSWGHFSPPDHDGWDAGFDLPFGIAVDNRGSIYVSDSRNGRVQQWTSAGGFVSSWGRGETYRGSFSPPAGVAVNPAGDVLAFDGTSGHIRVFDGVAPHRCRAVWGGWSEGLADGRFRRRTGSFGIAVDLDGDVYATDPGNHRVQKFTRNGRFLAAWGMPGGEPGQFRTPLGVAVDADRHVYVVDSLNHRVQKFDPTGAFVTQWGGQGAGPGRLHDPIAVAVADTGWVYVADAGAHQVHVFARAPTRAEPSKGG